MLTALLLPTAAALLRAPQPHPRAALPPPLRTLRGGTVAAALALPPLEPAVLGASLRSMTELVTCCGLGAVATRTGLIDRETTRALAKCVFNVFLPCMLFTSVTSTVAAGAGWSLALLPLAAACQVGLGLLFSRVLLRLARVPAHSPTGRDVSTLSAFGNSGVLPLIFADCLFRSSPAMVHACACACACA